MRFAGLVFAALCVCASAHNFLTMPASRNGNQGFQIAAGGTEMCDPGSTYTAGTPPAANVYTVGDDMLIEWTNNHPNSEDFIITIATYAANDNNLRSGAPLYQETFTSGPTQAPPATPLPSVTVPVPDAVGIVTVQFDWATGAQPWYNCADIQVLAVVPAGAVPAGDDIGGVTASEFTYITADGVGVFDISTDVLVCTIDGYTSAIDGDGNPYCDKTGSVDQLAYEFVLYFDFVEGDAPEGFSSSSIADALAESISADSGMDIPSSVFLVKSIDYIDADPDATPAVDAHTEVTVAIQPSGSTGAAYYYALFYASYNQAGSEFNNNPILELVDTTQPLSVETVPAATSAITMGDGEANTIAAGVMIPLAFCGIAGAVFFFRNPARERLAGTTGSASTYGIVTGVFTFILFLFILIASGAQYWSVPTNGDDVHLGPFEICYGSDCSDTVDVVSDNAVPLVNAVRALMLLSVFSILPSLFGLFIVALDRAGSYKEKLLSINTSFLVLTTMMQFSAACMWGAFQNDYLDGSWKYSYSYALVHINWVIGLLCSVGAYAISVKEFVPKSTSSV